MGKNKISRRSFVKQLGLMGVAVSGIASVSAALPINSEDREKISLRKRSVPISKGWDVIVVGGGPSGCTAAIAAAREGAKTLLIESTGMLGGMGTAGLMNAWCPFTDGEKIIYNGLAEKVMRAAKKGVPHVPENSYNWLPINTEQLKRVYDEMVLSSGASVLLFTLLSAVEMKNDETIDSIIVSNKAGLTAYKAKVYIDCTGDGDMAAWAGADFLHGDESEKVQSATLCFSMANVNQQNYNKARYTIEGAKPQSPIHKILASGKYPLIPDSHFNVKMSAPSFLMFNAGHIQVNSTDPLDLSDAMIRGRQLVKQMDEGLHEFAPEIFGDSYLSATGSLLGLRESRRIVGDYLFTIDDWLARRSFDDEIGRNCYYIDVHKKNKKKRYPRYSKGESHGIPYRCLTPKKLKNVLVAGRCISTDEYAFGSLRVMPACLVTGEAAGLAGALAVRSEKPDVHEVDVTLLRKRLKEEEQNIR